MSYKVTNRATGTTFEVEEGETVLAAAHRHSLHLRYSCQTGTCASCKAQVVDGQLSYPLLPPNALSQSERDAGVALLCQAIPSSDLTIVAREIEALKRIHPNEYPARISALDHVAADVVRLELTLPADSAASYLAGQYLDVLLGSGRRPFSIANAPGTADSIELHIRRVDGGGFTTQLFGESKVGDVIRVELPLGTFFLRDRSPRPIIGVAGGTGFAPIKAIVEQALLNGDERPITLYWGARTAPELYLADLVASWTQQHEHLQFIPVLSEPDSDWSGRTGLVHDAVLVDHPDLSAFDLYMSGPPALIEAGCIGFLAQGLPAHQLFYDSLEFAPDVEARACRRKVDRQD